MCNGKLGDTEGTELPASPCHNLCLCHREEAVGLGDSIAVDDALMVLISCLFDTTMGHGTQRGDKNQCGESVRQ
jgi:hypothetical protein